MNGHRAEVVVIGVGSEYRADDGVGPAVLAALRDAVPDRVALLPSDGEPTRLVEAWTGVPVAIVVDAVAGTGSAPGALYRLEIAAGASELPVEPSTSSHALGVGAAVALAQALDRLPGRLIVHGIEGADFSQGIAMSPPVVARVGELAAAVLADIQAVVKSR